MAFWILGCIVFDKALLAAVESEANLCFRDDKVDIQHLRHSPTLESVYNETLRLVNGAISARKVIAPTEIGGKTLSKGNSIPMSHRQFHFIKDVFGDDVEAFNPDRILNNKELLHNSSFRPYGGGSTYCPGRFLADQEI